MGEALAWWGSRYCDVKWLIDSMLTLGRETLQFSLTNSKGKIRYDLINVSINIIDIEFSVRDLLKFEIEIV